MFLRAWTFWHRSRKRRTIEHGRIFLCLSFLWHSLSEHYYLISLLCTTVAKASASSCITILVRSSPDTPGMSRSPTASSAIRTSYPKRAASRAVVDTQTCACKHHESALLPASSFVPPRKTHNIPRQHNLRPRLPQILLQIRIRKRTRVVLANHLLSIPRRQLLKLLRKV